MNQIILVVIIIFIGIDSEINALIGRLSCYECKHNCWTADRGMALEMSIKMNHTCLRNCIDFPKQAFNSTKLMIRCDAPTNRCASIHGLLKYQLVDDDSIFTIRYIQRTCLENCKTQLCDLHKIEECNFPDYIKENIKSSLEEEKAYLTEMLHGLFGGVHKLRGLGIGAELTCCNKNGCNQDKEIKVAHTYLKEDL